MPDTAVQQLVDIEAIRQLKARYFRHLDRQDWAGWRGVFADDVEFTGDGHHFNDADAFVAHVASVLQHGSTVHRGYTSEITINGPDTATGIWAMSDYAIFPGDGAPTGFDGCGHYHEDYVRTAGGWRIQRVVLKRLRIDPLDGGFPDIAALASRP